MKTARRTLRFLTAWLTTVRGAALCAVLIPAAFVGMNALGRGTVQELGYTLTLIGAGLAAAAAVSLFRYAGRRRALDKVLSNLPQDASALPKARDDEEEGFRALANAYREARNGDAAAASAAERERLDYFTLWVHQIKTPIAALDLMAQSDDPVDRALLRQEVFQIGQYADAALSYQRLQSLTGDLVLTAVPLYPLCCSVVKQLRPLFLYRKISLHMEPFEGEALSDAKWLGMAITQVMTNALKYTPPGGTVTVTTDGPLLLTIRDTGAGIPAEDLPRVFDRGFTGRLGRAERDGEKSTGIGLYLCREACDKLGHRVSIASRPGEGTAVTFDLRRERFESFS